MCDDCSYDSRGWRAKLTQCDECHSEVEDEYSQLRKAYIASDMLPIGIPKPKGVVSVRLRRRWYLGVLMEHIQGKHPTEDEFDAIKNLDGYDLFEDAHEQNFIIRARDRKVFRIDLGHFDNHSGLDSFLCKTPRRKT